MVPNSLYFMRDEATTSMQRVSAPTPYHPPIISLAAITSWKYYFLSPCTPTDLVEKGLVSTLQNLFPQLSNGSGGYAARQQPLLLALGQLRVSHLTLDISVERNIPLPVL